MTTATGSFAVNFSALSDANPYTNASLTYITADRGKILSAVFRWASGSNFRCAARYNGSVSGNLAAKIEFGTAAGGGDSIAAIIVDSTGAGYAAVCNSATSISLIRVSALTQADVLGSYAPSLVAGDVVELRLNQTTHALTVHINNGSAVISATDSTVTAGLTPGFMAIADNTGNATIKSFGLDGSATAAVLSSATPSGTLGTTTTATIGATTDQNTGTFYAVVAASSGALTGITATQIKAGQVASGSAAPFSGNAAVSTTSPSVGITGLTANTTYYFAIVQNNTNGDSNVINTGSFTTANVPAVLSSPTPSGLLGTTTTATLGATTTQNSGTLYAIISAVSSDVSGATAANIKAGQKSGGSAAPFSGNAAISTTTPSIAITGLNAGTTYYYALIQNNSNGDSNIPTVGTFTTAAATPTGAVNFDCDTNGTATTNFVPDAGSNRVVSCILSHEQTTGTRPLTAVTVGGVSFTRLGSPIVYGQGTSYAYIEFWYCLESSIAAIASNPTVQITPTSPGIKFVSGTLCTALSVNQDYTTWQTVSNTQACGTDLTGTLSAGNSWPVFGGATATIGGAGFTTGATVTEITGSDRNFNSSGSRAMAFTASASGSTIAITTGSTSTNTAMSQAMLAVAFPRLATRSTSITLRDSSGVLLTNQTRNFWTRTNLGAAATDGGSTGIAVTCGLDGIFNVPLLSIAAGSGFLTMSDPADANKSHNFPVTFA